ncbi:MAG: hypothetical protein ABSD20_01300 [Terriglobales bacterium]|jgi:hypothetical protein
MYRLTAALVLVIALASCARTPVRVAAPALARTHEQCVQDYQFVNCDLAPRHGGQTLQDCHDKARIEAERTGHACENRVVAQASLRAN